MFAGGGSVSTGEDGFPDLVVRLQREKPTFSKRQQDLLALRYDLTDRPSKSVAMSDGKSVQTGIRVRLRPDLTWEKLASLPSEEIRGKNLWPEGFYPLPDPHHEAGGMVFPQATIDEARRQTMRDLSRFDVDFDLPQHLLSDFPPTIYLTTRSDLGDVSRRQLVTLANSYELFQGFLKERLVGVLVRLVMVHKIASPRALTKQSWSAVATATDYLG